jgi:SET domain-containing protein
MNNIEAPESEYLYKELSQLSNAGQGLHTAIDIFKGEIIAVYRGKIITDEQANIRIKAKKDRYFMNMPDGSIMDSMQAKCMAKYANDASAFSDSGFSNNSRITLDEEENVCLIATRNIRIGEEIFCSYGKRYWKKHRSE